MATSSSVLREGGDNFNRAAPIVKIVQRFRGGGVCEVPAPAPTSASEAAVEVSVNTEGDAQQVSLRGYFSVLLISCFMWSGALGISDLLQS